MSDQVGYQNVGFLTSRLNLFIFSPVNQWEVTHFAKGDNLIASQNWLLPSIFLFENYMFIVQTIGTFTVLILYLKAQFNPNFSFFSKYFYVAHVQLASIEQLLSLFDDN